MSNIGSLKRQAEALLAKLDGGKRYLVKDFNERLQTAAEQYPQDTVIRSMASVSERMTRKEPDAIISQAEIEDLYQHLVGLSPNSTRFRSVLGDMLKSAAPEASTVNEEFIAAHRDSGADLLDYSVNMGFDGIFDKEDLRFTPNQVNAAKDKVEKELRSMGFGNPRLKLADGNSRFLIFSAAFDTNKGVINVNIPADASGDKFPTVFMNGDEFVDLNKANLKEYIHTASTYQPVLTTSATTIDLPKAPVPEPLKPLASEIEENVLEASVGFPASVVRLAKRILVAELSTMGFKNSQLRVSAPTHDGFVCEATLNAPNGYLNIEIPVEVKDGAPLLPTVFAKDDYVADFTKENLHKLAMNTSQKQAFVRGGELMSMGFGELQDNIVRCATAGNYKSCDEILEVIAQRFDEDTYRNAVIDYQKVLKSLMDNKEILRQAYEDRDQFIQTPNSLYPIHKTLRRPAHELIRDEEGNYHVKATYYARQRAEAEADEFSTARMLYGE